MIIVRDTMGAYAMSGICTHQCCLLSLCENTACTTLGTNPGECGTTAIATPAPTGAAMICACHGSAFAIDGKVLTGPAVRSLPHYSATTRSLTYRAPSRPTCACSRRASP